jgi:hypothetical protein
MDALLIEKQSEAYPPGTKKRKGNQPRSPGENRSFRNVSNELGRLLEIGFKFEDEPTMS